MENTIDDGEPKIPRQSNNWKHGEENFVANRDNIIIYVLVSSLLLAVVTALFIPSLQGMTMTFALDAAAEAKVIEGFKAYGKVELYPGRRAGVERVERPDDVAGVVREGDRYAVVVEGNEPADVGRMTGAVLDRILAGQPLAAIERVSLGKASPLVKETAAAALPALAPVLGKRLKLRPR